MHELIQCMGYWVLWWSLLQRTEPHRWYLNQSYEGCNQCTPHLNLVLRILCTNAFANPFWYLLLATRPSTVAIGVVVKVSIDVPAIRVEVVEIVLFVILTVQYGNCGLSVLNIRFRTVAMVFQLSLLHCKDIVILFCIERVLDVRTFVLVDLSVSRDVRTRISWISFVCYWIIARQRSFTNFINGTWNK